MLRVVVVVWFVGLFNVAGWGLDDLIVGGVYLIA